MNQILRIKISALLTIGVVIGLFMCPTVRGQGPTGTNINNVEVPSVPSLVPAQSADSLDFNARLKTRSGGFFLQRRKLLRFGSSSLLKPSPAFAQVVLGTTNSADYLSLYAGASERVRIATDGSVGIGTTAPHAPLEVVGRTISTNLVIGANATINDTTGVAQTLQFANHSAGAFVSSSADAYIYKTSTAFSSLSPQSLIFQTRSDANGGGFAFVRGSTPAVAMYIQGSDGNVGIGAMAPSMPLQIGDGTQSARRIRVDGVAGSSHGLEWYTGSTFKGGVLMAPNATSNLNNIDFYTGANGSTPMMTIAGTGNVGIGTTSPNAPLEVKTSSGSTGGIGHRWSYGGDPTNYHLDLQQTVSSNVVQWNFNQTNNATLYSNVLVLDQGNVGIGKTAPGYKLDVNGTINSNSTITGNNIVAKYQDVAEWVESSEQLDPGTVVILDPNKSNQVVSSTQPYDTRVAGVISAQPGITLGEKSDSKVLVATTGRVRVKVDATKSPIQIGDLLVTSDVPGVAMRSEPVEFAGRKMHMPGTLIGKALEPLAKGKGEILVLLSLQ